MWIKSLFSLFVSLVFVASCTQFSIPSIEVPVDDGDNLTDNPADDPAEDVLISEYFILSSAGRDGDLTILGYEVVEASDYPEAEACAPGVMVSPVHSYIKLNLLGDSIQSGQITFTQLESPGGVVPCSSELSFGEENSFSLQLGENTMPGLYEHNRAVSFVLRIGDGQGSGDDEGGEGGDPEPEELFSVGDIGPAGGIVFITPNTQGNETGMYFEIQQLADKTDLPWIVFTQNPPLIGNTGTEIGTGSSNTDKILAIAMSSGLEHPAAQYCNRLNSGGSEDWFLPSVLELYELYGVFENFYMTFFSSSSEASAGTIYMQETKIEGGKLPLNQVLCARMFAGD